MGLSEQRQGLVGVGGGGGTYLGSLSGGDGDLGFAAQASSSMTHVDEKVEEVVVVVVLVLVVTEEVLSVRRTRPFRSLSHCYMDEKEKGEKPNGISSSYGVS